MNMGDENEPSYAEEILKEKLAMGWGVGCRGGKCMPKSRLTKCLYRVCGTREGERSHDVQLPKGVERKVWNENAKTLQEHSIEIYPGIYVVSLT